jgi:hypothetical protein
VTNLGPACGGGGGGGSDECSQCLAARRTRYQGAAGFARLLAVALSDSFRATPEVFQ